MADQSGHDDTLKELEELLKDKDFCQMFERRNDETTSRYLKTSNVPLRVSQSNLFLFSFLASSANESTMSIITPSDPLNTAFINVNLILFTRK
jgi:hypothetical protein